MYKRCICKLTRQSWQSLEPLPNCNLHHALWYSEIWYFSLQCPLSWSLNIKQIGKNKKWQNRNLKILRILWNVHITKGFSIYCHKWNLRITDSLESFFENTVIQKHFKMIHFVLINLWTGKLLLQIMFSKVAQTLKNKSRSNS